MKCVNTSGTKFGINPGQSITYTKYIQDPHLSYKYVEALGLEMNHTLRLQISQTRAAFSRDSGHNNMLIILTHAGVSDNKKTVSGLALSNSSGILVII